MTCTCKNIPKPEAIWLLDGKGATIASYHKACPIHGVTATDVLSPARRESAWVSKEELKTSYKWWRGKDSLRLVQTSPDGSKGLLEWLEWNTEVPAENTEQGDEDVPA